jgi:hypothetical protein
MEFGSIVRGTCRWALSSAARCSWRSALLLTWSWSTSCPDRDLFAALAPSLDAVVLLAGSGTRDLAGASVTCEHLVRSLSRRVALPAAGGEGSHLADVAAGALTCLCSPRSARNFCWRLTCFTACRREVRPRAPWLLLPTRCWHGVFVGARGPWVSVSPAVGRRSGTNGAPRLGWVRRFSICGGRGYHARSPLASDPCTQGH